MAFPAFEGTRTKFDDEGTATIAAPMRKSKRRKTRLPKADGSCGKRRFKVQTHCRRRRRRKT